GAVAQGDVQDGPVLGGVDPLAGEHLLGPALEVGLAGQVVEQRHRLLGDAVLGEVEEDVAEAEGELVEALRGLAEQVAHLERLDLLEVGLRGLPGLRLRRLGHRLPPFWKWGTGGYGCVCSQRGRGIPYPPAASRASLGGVEEPLPPGPPPRFGEG